MKLGEVGGYALHQLRQRPLRTALTTCGVAVGVTALVILVSLASGVEDFLVRKFTTSELMTRVTVRQSGGMSLWGREDEKPGPPVTEETVSQLAELPGATVAYPAVRPILFGDVNERLENMMAAGLPLKALNETHEKSLLAGKYWESNDAGPVCVLPSGLLKDLGFPKPGEAIGAKLALTSFRNANRYDSKRVDVPDGQGGTRSERRYTRQAGVEVREVQVLGVYDSEAFGMEGMLIHVPLAEAMLLDAQFGLPNRRKEGEFEAAFVKVASPDPQSVTALQERIGERGYAAQSIYDILKPIEWVFFVIKGLLGVFGGIGLVVAFFGIANTMLMAVLERTREIGVLKALGARDRDIRRIFLTEALCIGFLGGLIGLGFGWLGGKIADAILSSVAEQDVSVFLVTPTLAGVVIGIAMAVAGIAGLYPAWRAARLIPVEALRRD